MHGPAGPLSRTILQPHPSLRDDAKAAFRAYHHAVRPWARAGPGQTPALDHAFWRDGTHRLHEIVDMGVERCKVPAAARRNPAAERGIFEALREVSQSYSMRAQLCFERWSVGAAFDQGGARG